MLPSQFRLSKKKDFDMVFKKGRSTALRYFFIRWQKNQLKTSRIGIIVSNKVSKKATIRNTIKRRIREIMWTQVPLLGSVDIIIVAKQGSVNASYIDIRTDLEKIIDIIKKY